MYKNYLEIIFKCFDKYNLDYCVQNGYEKMPQEFPTDIDIFYRDATEKKLDCIVYEASLLAELFIVQKLAMGYKQFVYWLSPKKPNSGFQLELDFQTELSRLSMPHYYIPSKLLDRKKKYRDFYIPSPVDEIIYTVLRRTVKHNFTQHHLDVLKRAYNSTPTTIEDALGKELPKEVAIKVVSLIKCENVDIFEQYYPTFQKYVCEQSLKNNSIRKRLSQWWYNLTRMLPLRFLRPAGMDIALLAPDGGGKSTILEALKAYEITSFSSVERKYIRPGLFKNIGQYKPNAQPEMIDNPDPHGRKPDGLLKSWLRFLIYLIDFTIGYFIKVVPLKWQRKLVVFDRYYYDYYVDMYRYHYSLPHWVPRLFSFLIPSPAITFILYASAEVIYNRKKELTFEETRRQCNAFKQLSTTLPNCVLIDVDRPIEAIVEDIVTKIVKRRVELTQKKLKQ